MSPSIERFSDSLAHDLQLLGRREEFRWNEISRNMRWVTLMGIREPHDAQPSRDLTSCKVSRPENPESIPIDRPYWQQEMGNSSEKGASAVRLTSMVPGLGPNPLT